MIKLCLRRLVINTTALIVASIGSSQSWQAKVPMDAPEMPYYFSGTNCRASGIVSASSMPYAVGVVRAELYINDQLIKAQDYVRPMVGPSCAASLSQMFDSTHFADNTSVTVKFRAKDNYGDWHEAESSATVINKAVLYGRYDLEVHYLNKNHATGEWVTAVGEDETPYRALPAALSAMASSGYAISKHVTSIGWDSQEYLGDLSNCNIAALSTHSDSTSFWCDTNDYWFEYQGNPGPQREIYALSVPFYDPHGEAVLPWRSAAIGTGLPPYNSTGSPAINLTYLCTCDAATTNDFAEAYLTPCANFYKPFGILIPGASMNVPENQALVGYAMHVEVSSFAALADAFWQALADGWDVDQARRDAFDAYQGSNKPPFAEDFLHVWGDFYMRLKGVYTQLPGLEARWYCDLP